MSLIRGLLDAGFERVAAVGCRATRHDLVLAVIPASFLVAALVGAVSAVNTTSAVGAAGTLSGLAVVDALFRNPPGPHSTGRRTA